MATTQIHNGWNCHWGHNHWGHGSSGPEFFCLKGLQIFTFPSSFALNANTPPAHNMVHTQPSQFHDIYHTLDDDLKQDLEYAWSLPHNPRFVEQMQMVQEIAQSYDASLTPNLEKSMIAYILWTIRKIVTVSNLCQLDIPLWLSIDMNRIELSWDVCNSNHHHLPILRSPRMPISLITLNFQAL